MIKKVKKRTRQEKQQPAVHKPWFFLGMLLAFCIALTYGYGAFYIPSLPDEEIPPFLMSAQPDVSTETVSQAIQMDVDTAVQPSTDMQTAADTVSAYLLDASTQSAETLYSRREGVYNILAAGKDDAAWNTDVLLLVSFDTQNGTASAAQIPRDTYIDGGKINALWAKYKAAAARSGAADPSADAMEALCDTLEVTLAVRIDHWVLCDLSAFREIVDAVGGVTVDVPCSMQYEDPAQGLVIDLKQGVQRLDGEQAEQLVRFRSGYLRGDLGRVEVQKLFLSALLAELQQVSLLELPTLAQTAITHVSTGMRFSDLLFFAKSAAKLDLSQVTLFTLPGTDCREYGDSGAWYYVLSRSAVLTLVNEHLNVYTQDITDALFDPSMRLTNRSAPTLLSYYQYDIPAAVSTAASISENGVNVAVTH